MPEGDTIFRAARTLHRALGGRVVTAFDSVYPALTRVHDDAPITGRTVERVWSQGKHLLIAFSGDLVLRTHMRMNGSWHIYRPGERGSAPAATCGSSSPPTPSSPSRSRSRSPNGSSPTTCRATGRSRRSAPTCSPPTSRGRSRWSACARASALSIGDALLDQRALAGIGNVYKSEVCFLCRVSPFTPVRELDDETLGALVDTAQRLLRANVADRAPGAIVTYRGLRRTTGRSDPEERLWVYGRAGRPCRRCGNVIEMRKDGEEARVTYYCAGCQST